ncbi:MAG TPA: ATPase domain-containing protein [Tepidisphaeraceae bacterium]|nr:ATPase domain-containing protein [Tepidisphaeraceae bacterium]
MSKASAGHEAPAATGIVGLDAILGGGLPRGNVYLVQGDPGVGKTTLGLQFLLAGQPAGERGLYITLSESRPELVRVAASHGWDLGRLEVVEVAPDSGDGDPRAVEEDQYDVFHPAEVELGQVVATLTGEVERVRPARVVVDSLSELRLLARDPLRYRRHLLALKRFFVGRGCTVLLLEASTGGPVGDLHSNTLVHGVLSLEQATPAYGVKRRRLNILKLRGVRFDDSYHDFRIVTGGLQVFPRLVADAHAGPPGHRAGAADLPSGAPQLDQMLGGGLPRGKSAMFVGPAGAGKSTLADQYVLAAASRREAAVVYTFDESTDTRMARADSFGMKLRAAVEDGGLVVQQVDPGALAPGEFAAMVRHQVETRGARIVVVDSLNGYLNATPDERFLLVQLHELLTYLGHKGVCTLLVLGQQGLLGATVDVPVDVSYLADAVLFLRYFEHAGEVRTAVSVVKKRTGRHERTIREFRLAAGGVQVGEPLRGFSGVLTGTPTYAGRGRPGPRLLAEGAITGGDDAGDGPNRT